MLFLASYVLKGQSQAALVAVTMAILGLVLPPAAWVSGAAVVLITLVVSSKSGLVTALLAVVGAGVFTLLFPTQQVFVVIALLIWSWITALVLRQTVSLSYSLQVLTVVTLLAVTMIFAVMPNMAEHLREPLDIIVEELAQQSDELSYEELKQAEDWAIKFAPGLFVISIFFGTILSLFLGRWWQAVFYNPGGFGEEFRSLNLGKISAMSAVALIFLALAMGSVFAFALVTVVFVLYSIQALSLLHAVVKIRQINAVWLFVVYLIMLFVPQVLLLLILAGFADPWIGLRQRISKKM